MFALLLGSRFKPSLSSLSSSYMSRQGTPLYLCHDDKGNLESCQFIVIVTPQKKFPINSTICRRIIMAHIFSVSTKLYLFLITWDEKKATNVLGVSIKRSALLVKLIPSMHTLLSPSLSATQSRSFGLIIPTKLGDFNFLFK